MTLQTDKLTGLLNRWCYERHIENLNFNTAVCIFDVNSVKSVNEKKVKALIKVFNAGVTKTLEEDPRFTGISVGYGMIKKGKSGSRSC